MCYGFGFASHWKLVVTGIPEINLGELETENHKWPELKLQTGNR